MKLFIGILSCALAVQGLAVETDNLIRSPDFAHDDFGAVRGWSLRDMGDVAEPLPKEGPHGLTALRLDLSKGRQYIQSGLKLVPGEPYRLSIHVRAKGFPKGAVEFMVRNPSWNKCGPKIYLPNDTQGAWKHVTVTSLVERASEDSYYVSFYLAQPTPGAMLEVAGPKLEALSEKGRSGSHVPGLGTAVSARIVPIDPLLSDLNSNEAAMIWYFGGFLPQPCGEYQLESSLDGGAWISAPFDDSRRVRLSHGRIAPGRHALAVRLVAKDGSVHRAHTYQVIAVAHGRYPEGRRLNNFVTELLSVPLRDGAYSFANPRRGSVYFDLGRAEPTAEVRLGDDLVIAPGRGVRSEGVRLLDAGEYRLAVKNVTQPGLTLRVHAVQPVPHHGSALHKAVGNIREYVYGRDFYDRFLPLFYTEVGAPHFAATKHAIAEWAARRGTPVTSEFGFNGAARVSPEASLAKIRQNGAFDEGLDVWLDELGIIHPRDDHIVLGETLWGIQRKNAVNVWWADAIRAWFKDAPTHAAEISGTVNSGEGRGSLYAEVYPGILATAEETYAQETNYIRFANSASALVPAAKRHTVFCFSGYIAPEGWNTYPAPEGDYKVFFDHFMHRLATDPEFANAGGLGSTAFQHIDEEQVRFIAAAIRHYALEGCTDSLAVRFGWKYAPGHLKNCDFAEGLRDWTVEAAEPGSIVAAVKKDYGFRVQFRREVPKGYGDRLVKLTRCATGPNRLRQTVTGLKPGAYYILTYHSTDEADVDNPGTPCRDFVLRAELKGATMRPKLSFDRLWPEDLDDRGSRAGRPNDLGRYALACTHRVVFRAEAPTAELTISDWADDSHPGAPIGRTRLLNYMILRPYYIESERQLAQMEDYLQANVGTTDKGGLSFDFRALSAKRFGSSSGGANIAKGTQAQPAYGFIYDSSKTDSSCGVPAVEVKKHISWKEEGDERVISNGAGLLGVCGGNAEIAAHAMSSWQTVVPLPDAEGGVYRLAFDYKMNHTIGRSGGCIVRTKAGFAVNQQFENCDSEWKPFVGVFPTTKGEKSVQVNLNFMGVGMLRYRGLSLVRETAATRVIVTSCVHGQVDKSFAVGAGQVGCITYMWKRRFGEPKFDAKDFTFRLTLPKGFSFQAATWAKKGEAKVTARADGSTEILLPAKGNESPTYSYRDSNWTRFGVLVRASQDAPEGRGTFEVLYRGETVSNVEPTRWFTIAPVKVAVKPRRYRNGFFPGSGYGVYDDEQASFEYAKMASDAGADWWIPETAPVGKLLDIYRRAGISLITPQTGGVRDGFVVHGGGYATNKDIPASDRYVARTTEGGATVETSVCPFTVIEESPFFRTNTLPKLRAKLLGVNGVWANWEPYNFVNQGCMCERCRKAFAQYLKMPETALMKNIWHKEAKAGGKYAAENRKFRSLVHAKLVKALNRHITAMTGGADASQGLIPGIAWCEMSSFWRPNDYPAESKAIDYAGALRWMDPWGPYPCWNLDGLFAAQEGFNIAYWFAAKNVREQVNKDYPLPNRPKLMAFPQGAMACEWITEPEWIGLALDSFFFNGWEASVVYFFPKGYDARYWQCFAEATKRAAKYEDFIFDGRRCDGEVTLRTPGFTKIYAGKVSHYLPDENVSLVQHAAYEKDGKLIVAVLNFADAEGAAVEIGHPKFGVKKGFIPAARCRVFEL